MTKYRNEKTTVDGIEYDSKREAKRASELKILERAGEIKGVQRQVRYPLYVNGVIVAHYVCDFTYFTRHGATVIEDVKSPFTRKLPVYRLKAKIMAAMGHPVVEV